MMMTFSIKKETKDKSPTEVVGGVSRYRFTLMDMA